MTCSRRGDRENPLEAIQLLNQLTLDEFSTIIFPEGTRSRDGSMLPFKKGPFVAAIHLAVPVVPVVCKGTKEVMPKGKHLSIIPGEVEIVVLEPIPTNGMTYDDRDRLQYRRDDGAWASLAVACTGAAEPAVGMAPVGRTCMYNGATVATESTICKSSVTFRCDDGEWLNLGTACR